VKWLEFARRGLDVHFPSRIATSIPSYNLRWASKCIHDSLFKKQQVQELEILQQDAINQRLGAELQGYDHKYGEELPLGSDIYTGAQPVTPTVVEAKELARENQKRVIKRINWLNTIILFGTPIAALYGVTNTPCSWKTFFFALSYYYFSGLGITAGYHRLFAHRSYEASWIVRLFLMLGGTAALEGSVKWWCGGHRVHHRYTDTPKDPYNAKHGFWWAHMGWMLINADKKSRSKLIFVIYKLIL